MNRRRKKPETPRAQIIAILVCCIILMSFIVLAVKLAASNSKVKQLLLENESMKQELYVETGDDNQMQTAEAPAVDEDGLQNESLTPGDTAPQDADVSPDKTTEAMTEPPGTTVPETEPQKLETLDGVAAGTVVSASELDMSDLDKYFQAYEIKTTGSAYSRINGKSYRENPNVKLSDLRYLKVLHYNYNHDYQVGEIIVNAGLAEEMLQIFRELYDAEYEVESMHLVDNYWTGDGDTTDSASIDVNNTSSFNYRAATGGSKLSNHAYGFAIDINPQQNPYVSYKNGKASWSHKNANDYIARDTGLPHMITREDTAYKIFKAHGFKWGGDWENPKDYQHFEKKLN